MPELPLKDVAPSEAARLRDVYALRLLDTQREERFDRYADLLADIFDVQVAYVSLVNEERQWFKAIHGTGLRELDRKDSFCAYTIDNDALLVVEDLTRDARFAEYRFVTGESQLKFYAAVPIHGPSGYPVGTVGLLDTRPRTLTSRQRRHLELLGRMLDQELLHGHQVDELRQELQRTAYYDPITGLANQRLLIDRLEFAIGLAIQEDKKVFYALVDLQHFGTVNQAHGWHTGNEILRAVARRLAERHPRPRVVARWSGDQFVVVCPMSDMTADPARFADDVMRCFDATFAVRDEEFHLSARVGISVAPDHGTDALALIRCGHSAMRAAAQEGGSHYRVYSPRLEQVAVRRQSLAERLRAGLRQEDIYLAYQPLWSVQTGCYCGAEALLRWDDAELGYVPPEELLAVAERVGLQEELELAVLKRACKDAMSWRRRGCDVPVSVNLSAIQFYGEHLVDNVNRTLEETGLPPQRLTLEVTEQSMVADLESAVSSMQQLSEKGVRFAIDDFGTGYSSFAYLADLPVHALKIDRQIVKGIDRGHNSASIVTGIVHLAHALGLTVVAEGVESEDQIAFLRGAGCDELQGFFLSRPTSPNELPAVINRL